MSREINFVMQNRTTVMYVGNDNRVNTINFNHINDAITETNKYVSSNFHTTCTIYNNGITVFVNITQVTKIVSKDNNAIRIVFRKGKHLQYICIDEVMKTADMKYLQSTYDNYNFLGNVEMNRALFVKPGGVESKQSKLYKSLTNAFKDANNTQFIYIEAGNYTLESVVGVANQYPDDKDLNIYAEPGVVIRHDPPVFIHALYYGYSTVRRNLNIYGEGEYYSVFSLGEADLLGTLSIGYLSTTNFHGNVLHSNSLGTIYTSGGITTVKCKKIINTGSAINDGDTLAEGIFLDIDALSLESRGNIFFMQNTFDSQYICRNAYTFIPSANALQLGTSLGTQKFYFINNKNRFATPSVYGTFDGEGKLSFLNSYYQNVNIMLQVFSLIPTDININNSYSSMNFIYTGPTNITGSFTIDNSLNLNPYEI